MWEERTSVGAPLGVRHNLTYPQDEHTLQTRYSVCKGADGGSQSSLMERALGWAGVAVIPALYEQWKEVAKLDASLYHLARPYLKAAHMCHQVAKIKELLTQSSCCFPFDRVLQTVRSIFPFFP